MTDASNPITEAPPPPPAPVRTGVEVPTPFSVRIWSAFIFLMAGSMLAIGLYLHPSPTGTETHTQLGLLPCGFYRVTGVPCPTCGCTTAVSHFAHGHLIRSLYTQPFGFCVALLALTVLPLTSVGVVSGKWYGPSMFTLSWYWRYWVYGTIAIFLLGWLYKVYITKHP